MLIFATALVALMAGALFYAARIPTEIAMGATQGMRDRAVEGFSPPLLRT